MLYFNPPLFRMSPICWPHSGNEVSLTECFQSGLTDVCQDESSIIVHILEKKIKTASSATLIKGQLESIRYFRAYC